MPILTRLASLTINRFQSSDLSIRCFTDVLSLTIANSTKTYDTRHLP